MNNFYVRYHILYVIALSQKVYWENNICILIVYGALSICHPVCKNNFFYKI